jgi:putative oxidoreductase
MSSVGLLLIRVAVGLLLLMHGAAKLNFLEAPAEDHPTALEGFASKLDEVAQDTGRPYNLPNAITAATAAAWTEFLGGGLLILGLLTRVAAIPLTFVMMVAVTFHWQDFSQMPVYSVQAGGIELPFTVMLITLGLLFTGPGWISLDGIFGGIFAKKAEA